MVQQSFDYSGNIEEFLDSAKRLAEMEGLTIVETRSDGIVFDKRGRKPMIGKQPTNYLGSIALSGQTMTIEVSPSAKFRRGWNINACLFFFFGVTVYFRHRALTSRPNNMIKRMAANMGVTAV